VARRFFLLLFLIKGFDFLTIGFFLLSFDIIKFWVCLSPPSPKGGKTVKPQPRANAKSA
jgi:hypothetical protein